MCENILKSVRKKIHFENIKILYRIFLIEKLLFKIYCKGFHQIKYEELVLKKSHTQNIKENNSSIKSILNIMYD